MSDPQLSTSWPDTPLTVIIGAGAMGSAVAKRLGQRSRLLIADLNLSSLKSLASELTSSGYSVTTEVCDVTVEDSVKALANSVERQGGFQTLAHVTGLSPSMADSLTIMKVNLVGPALMSRYFAPLATVNSVAIFVSSLAGHMANPTGKVKKILSSPLSACFLDRLTEELGEEFHPSTSYMLSKHALIDMCQRQAPIWGQNKARIVSISPGLIESPMGALEFKNEPRKFGLLDLTPLKRQGNMHEISDAVEFLASPKASFISGIDLLVDGGVFAATKHRL